MKSSFVRKGKAAASAPAMPGGTRLSAQNGALQISSGLADFDEIFSGGIAVGSMVLVEEDVFSDYNQMLLKYFAAEGVACRQQLFVSCLSAEEDSSVSWVRKLPFVAGSPPTPGSQSEPKEPAVADIESSGGSGEDMKIAFQYKKYMTAETMHSSKPVSWCHSYDLNKPMEASYISVCDISSISWTTSQQVADIYRSVYDHLNKLIYASNESLSKGGAATISRIVLPSLGSAFYAAKYASDEEHKTKLLSFLRALRGLLRQSLATCMISFPAHLFSSDRKFVQRLRHTADGVVQFSAFTDSPNPVSPAFATFDGLFTVLKGPSVGSLVPSMPAPPSFTFQFKRKRLYIEKIHLPPDMSILEDKQGKPDQNEGRVQSRGAAELICGTGPSKSQSLDF